MNYNVKVNIERVRGKFNSTVELSGPGRSGILHSSTDSFEACLAQTKAHHDELLARVEAFVKPPEVAAQQEVASAAQAKDAPKPPAKPKADKVKTVKQAKTGGKAAKGKGGSGKDTGATAKKTPAQKPPAKRQFAAD